MEPPAAEAGAAILRLGGNAADAAIAAAFAQCVVDPIYAGIAGAFSGMFWDAKSGVPSVVAAGHRAPLAARADAWQIATQSGAVWTVKGDLNRSGYQASTVPGFVRAASEAFERYGSGNVSWGQLIEPAIQLALDGFDVYPYLFRLWDPNGEYSHGFLETMDGAIALGRTPAGRSIYLHEDGTVYQIGERLVQTDYGHTLERIAANGADEFYLGETAERMAADFQANGGWISLSDLSQVRTEDTQPVRTKFGRLELINEPPPSVGPVIAELFNILDGWGIERFGWNTARYLDRLARALHVVFRDRLEFLGDPEAVEVPLDELVSEQRALQWRRRIEEETDLGRFPVGARLHSETTHVTVVDREGNGAAITHSIGCSSGVVTPGLGFLHNSHMEMFDPRPGQRHSIAPGKRGLTGGGPALFVEHDELRVLIGSPGGARKVSSIVQAVLNMEWFGMDVASAVAVDRIHSENEPRLVIVEPHFPPNTLLDLAHLGQKIRFEWYTGRLAAVTRDVDGALAGGSDPRGGRGIAVV